MLSRRFFTDCPAALVLVLPFASAVAAQDACEARSPLDVVADRGKLDGLESVLHAEEARALRHHDRVRMTGFALPGGEAIDLDLVRIEIDRSELVLRVDGAPGAPPIEGELSAWTGHVSGTDDSDVFLAFSHLGTRGWILRGEDLLHVLAAPGPDGDWSRSRTRIVSEAALNARGFAARGACAIESLAAQNPRAAAGATLLGGTSAATTTTLVCRIAIETDYQLFQLFNNLGAEQVYVTSLFAAANARYVEQVNVALEMVYLGLHANANDGWTSGDTGAGSVSMLLEFQGAWQNNMPNGANLAHFVSGANLGGGAAWLDILCNTQYGFAASGNLNGQNPFPVTQSPLNWDFLVFTHETGHNFGSPHTHDFCPPLDQCAPSAYFGQCQSAQVCISNGTLMSYCHLCPSGIGGLDPHFHPVCVDLMRQKAEASCLNAFCTGPAGYCVAATNSTGVGALIGATGSTSIAANVFTLTANQLPHSVSGFFFYGPGQTQLALGNGWLCANGPLFRFPVQNTGASGTLSRLVNFTQAPAGSGPGKITPGTTWNFQTYYRDTAGGGAGYNLTNATSVPFCP